MIVGGFVNVMDYGAVGDGITDDISAINAAIAYVKATPNIKGVFFPSGNYKITGSIDARGNFNTGLELWGFRATITSTGNVPALQLNGRVPDTPPEVRMNAYVHGFVFQGPGKANTSSVGIEAARGANVVVKDCKIYNFYRGVYCFGNLISNYENLVINKCFYALDIAPDGIEFAPNDIHFLHCQIFDNDRVVRAVNFPNGSMTFIGCELEGNNLSGSTTDGVKVIDFTNAGKTTFLGCHIEENPGQYNIYYSSARRSLNLIGCEIIPGDNCGTVVEIDNGSGFAELFVEGSRVTNNVGSAQINIGTDCSAFIVGDTAGGVVGTNVTRVFDGFYAANTVWKASKGGPGGAVLFTCNRNGANEFEPGVTQTQDLGTNSIRWSRVFSNSLVLTDGITAPGAISGNAQIYVDAADGDLKIKFGDGTVKTIVTDT
jgi:hypothetical protein